MPRALTMSFSQRLKKIRKERGITQDKLAEKSDIHPSQIRKYESGIMEPNLKTIRDLAIALECSTDELIFARDDRKISAEFLNLFNAINSLDEEDKNSVKKAMKGIVMIYQNERL